MSKAREVRIEVQHGQSQSQKPRTDYVYVNPAYVGSTNSVNVGTSRVTIPPGTVIREQYWACSRWPYTQRILAVVVGVLLGAVIGLALSMALLGQDSDSLLPPLFRSEHTQPMLQ